MLAEMDSESLHAESYWFVGICLLQWFQTGDFSLE